MLERLGVALRRRNFSGVVGGGISQVLVAWVAACYAEDLGRMNERHRVGRWFCRMLSGLQWQGHLEVSDLWR